MRKGFPAIQEEGDLIAGEHAPQRIVIALELADQHRCFAIPPSPVPNVAENLVSRERGLGLRVGAAGDAQAVLKVRIKDSLLVGNPGLDRVLSIFRSLTKRVRLRPALLKVAQNGTVGETAARRVSGKNFDCNLGAWERREGLMAAPEGLSHDGPRGKP